MKDPSFVFIVMSPFLTQCKILLTTYRTFKFNIIYRFNFFLVFLEQFSEYFYISYIYILIYISFINDLILISKSSIIFANITFNVCLINFT